MIRGPVTRSKSSAETTEEMAANYVLFPAEVHVGTFTGTPHRLDTFMDELDAVWVQRPDLQEEQRGRKIWAHLSEEVRRELRCQGLGPKSKPDDITTALRDTYRDQRSLSQLSMSFHGCCQEGFEDLRQFSRRLHENFTCLQAAQLREGRAVTDDPALRDQLIDGLSSESLRIHLRQHRLMNPAATFKEVRDVAIKLQGEGPVPPTVNAVATPAPSTHPTPGVPTPDALQSTLEKMTSLLDNIQKTLHQQSRRPPPRSIICYSCGKPGHIARNCRSKPIVPGNDRSQP